MGPGPARITDGNRRDGASAAGSRGRAGMFVLARVLPGHSRRRPRLHDPPANPPRSPAGNDHIRQRRDHLPAAERGGNVKKRRPRLLTGTPEAGEAAMAVSGPANTTLRISGATPDPVDARRAYRPDLHASTGDR